MNINITEQDRLDAVENVEYYKTELSLELGYITELNKHWLIHENSKNLGYWRTFIECSCGAGWWAGTHTGDPSSEDCWNIHRAKVIRGEA